MHRFTILAAAFVLVLVGQPLSLGPRARFRIGDLQRYPAAQGLAFSSQSDGPASGSLPMMPRLPRGRCGGVQWCGGGLVPAAEARFIRLLVA
jgi:hypothetical protein